LGFFGNRKKKNWAAPPRRISGFWRIFALGKVSAIEAIENWSMKICHLSCKLCGSMPPAFRHPGEVHCRRQSHQKAGARGGFGQTSSNDQ
jgi:hypothetical protein